MNRKFLLAALVIGSFVLYLSSCSKTSEDKLAPVPCSDTTNVSYSRDIVPILSANCYECHGGTAAGSGGIKLDSYIQLKGHVTNNNNELKSAVTQDGRVTPMPYGRAKLPACELNHILAWMNQGAQNN